MYKKIDYKNLLLNSSISQDFMDGWHEVVCALAGEPSLENVNKKKIQIYDFDFHEQTTQKGVLLQIYYEVDKFIDKPVLKMIFEIFFKNDGNEITIDDFFGKKCKILTKRNKKTGIVELLKFAPME